MELEYLVRVPTHIGTIGILFENNGEDLFTLLETSEEDKRTFQLLGLDLDKLPLAEKDIFERLEGIVIKPASKIEFYDFRNGHVETHDPILDLANLTADVYSSLASFPALREELSRYEAKAQELENENKDTARRTKKGTYLFYTGLMGGIASSIAGEVFHPSTTWYTSSAAAILILLTIVYDRRVSARIKASNEQRINTSNQYIHYLEQLREDYQNYSAKIVTFKQTLLDTGWFPVGYGK